MWKHMADELRAVENWWHGDSEMRRWGLGSWQKTMRYEVSLMLGWKLEEKKLINISTSKGISVTPVPSSMNLHTVQEACKCTVVIPDVPCNPWNDRHSSGPICFPWRHHRTDGRIDHWTQRNWELKPIQPDIWGCQWRWSDLGYWFRKNCTAEKLLLWGIKVYKDPTSRVKMWYWLLEVKIIDS